MCEMCKSGRCEVGSFDSGRSGNLSSLRKERKWCTGESLLKSGCESQSEGVWVLYSRDRVRVVKERIL